MQKLLWTPSEKYVKESNMYAFMQYVNDKKGLSLSDYKSLYTWSVENISDFWEMIFKYMGIITSHDYTAVVDDINKFPGARWFTGAKLNYAENMLKFSKGNKGDALIFRGENKERRVITHDDMYKTVLSLAQALKNAGIAPGDTVAAYMPNLPETIMAMLAVTAVGGIWCSCATDIGSQAAVDRLGQVKPKVLFTVDGYYYKGKSFDVTKNAAAIRANIPTLQKVVVTHYAGNPDDIKGIADACMLDDFLAPTDYDNFRFEQVESNTPMVVMFSSGTTGKPKCMVQSVMGLLLNQLKELVLHTDMKPGDRMLYITTCSWMMWNWQAATVGTGASIVLYDGNPSYPDTSAIWKVLEEEKVTVFGLSASYIHALVAEGFSPKNTVNLEHLREISQTGSALSEDGFDFVYREIKSDLQFNSIAGGTDINGCFASGNPMSPVYSNELQAPGLGMPINCYDDNGKPIRGEQGELVCEKPTPSMPLYFWNDDDGERYMNAYFRVYPGIWHHGDYVSFNATGGITFYGRSDSVLKPSGVRIGTAEIYNIAEKLPEINESLAIGQNYHGDQRVILFVTLAEGAELTDELIKTIKTQLRTKASPRHVPAMIIAAPDIPKTLNGKKVESAVTNIVNGRKVTNRDALSNPESLDFYESILPQLNA
ncbi:MAG: acetoacetate--CoA ligase [Clostridia bacterium]|nr:acetoacetate--CoA ligase [Clostridia bacterium]